MKTGDKYFVRIDKKLTDQQLDKTTLGSHMAYIRKLASETELYAGGFKGFPGGMIVFRAKNFTDADLMCKQDPIVVKGYYSYNLYEWGILLTSLN